MTDLVSAARMLFLPGKGILAADESVATLTKRLAAHGITAGEEMRRQYRDLLLGALGAEEYLSGAILFEETLKQKGNDGSKFPVSLAARGIAPGVKVDGGTEPFPESADELITGGLLGLDERLMDYKKRGVVFTKWRAVIRIEGDRLPSAPAILENAKRLASYAKEAQAAGLVPIIEPEVLHEGRHSRKRSREVLEETLGTVFSVLKEHSVDLASLVLKTSMALSGSENAKRDLPDEVAEDTVGALMATAPRQLAGIAFLSGGQTPDQATDNLKAIVRRARASEAPWPMTFSYARALQEEALELWRGKKENVDKAREAYLRRLERVSAAVR